MEASSDDEDFVDLPGPSTRARVKRKRWPDLEDEDAGGSPSLKVGGDSSRDQKKKVSEDESKIEEKRRKGKQNGELLEVKRRKLKIKRQHENVMSHQLPEKLTRNVWLNLESLRMRIKSKRIERKLGKECNYTELR